MHLTQGIQRAAQTNAHGLATVFNARRRSWAETNDRIARLGRGMAQRGLKKGDRAAVLALNSDRYFEFLFAIPAAGGIVVPLNTRLAAPEIGGRDHRPDRAACQRGGAAAERARPCRDPQRIRRSG